MRIWEELPTENMGGVTRLGYGRSYEVRIWDELRGEDMGGVSR